MSTKLPKISPATDPDLSNLFEQAKRDVMMSLLCHHVGKIEAFDPETQTATVKIVYKRTFFKQKPDGGYDPELKAFPLLEGVPIVTLQGGKTQLRMPIAAGDECLLLFADKDIDNWLMTGNSEEGCNTLRLHNLSDAFALVGVSSVPRLKPGYPIDRASLYWDRSEYGEASPEAFVEFSKAGIRKGEVEVSTGAKVTFKNGSTTLKVQLDALNDQLTNLCTYLDALITQIKLITVPYTSPGGAATSGPPENAAAFTPIATNIDGVKTGITDVKTALGGLLQ